jgi:hypothetical protein
MWSGVLDLFIEVKRDSEWREWIKRGRNSGNWSVGIAQCISYTAVFRLWHSLRIPSQLKAKDDYVSE